MRGENIQIRQATVHDASTLAHMVHLLLTELGGFDFDEKAAATLCEQLLSSAEYTAFLAYDHQENPLGVLTLQVIPALYVTGYIGWIQEFYVLPEARSFGVGHQLLTEADAYAQKRQLQRLEVNTPDAPAGRAALSGEELLIRAHFRPFL